MKRHLLLISSFGFFLLAPVAQTHIYGAETSTTVVKADHKVMTDEQLNKAVKEAIISDANLVKFVKQINIKVEKGVVTLSGVVDSSDIKSNIESKAKAVKGVHKVVNNIEVKKVASK